MFRPANSDETDLDPASGAAISFGGLLWKALSTCG